MRHIDSGKNRSPRESRGDYDQYRPPQDRRSDEEKMATLRKLAAREGLSIEQYTINRMAFINPEELERWRGLAKKEHFDSLEQWLKYYLEVE